MVWAGWRSSLLIALLAITCGACAGAWAQTDCSAGNDVLDTAEPKGIAIPDLIAKFTAGEDRARDARLHYTYTQDVLVQTLSGNQPDGQWHQVSTISYDKGKRMENVTFSEVSTLRGVQMSAEDMDDIKVFMPWLLTSEEARQYDLKYAGQQHVDDLDTFVFLVEPKKYEKNQRYFQGRVWVDNHDLQVVKLCGKSVPEIRPKKKKDPQEIRPTFATWRQFVEGNWLPAYSRVDDDLHFSAQTIHIKEVVKFTGYKKAGDEAKKP